MLQHHRKKTFRIHLGDFLVESISHSFGFFFHSFQWILYDGYCVCVPFGSRDYYNIRYYRVCYTMCEQFIRAFKARK